MPRRATLLALLLFAAAPTRADYSPRMPPGHLACRHAAWVAAEACRADWPKTEAGSVAMRITVDRAGAVTRVATEPSVAAFEQCVRRRFGERRFPISSERSTVVVSRYVFAPAAAPAD